MTFNKYEVEGGSGLGAADAACTFKAFSGGASGFGIFGKPS